MLFRALTIAAIGGIGWMWFDPQSLGDIPFSQLTPNMIINNLFGVGIPIGCVVWFFNFPERGDEEHLNSDPYETWAHASGYVLLIES